MENEIDIDEKLKRLSTEQLRRFRQTLEDMLYSRSWCKYHGLDYAKPDMKKAKEVLYNQLYNLKWLKNVTHIIPIRYGKYIQV